MVLQFTTGNLPESKKLASRPEDRARKPMQDYCYCRVSKARAITETASALEALSCGLKV